MFTGSFRVARRLNITHSVGRRLGSANNNHNTNQKIPRGPLALLVASIFAYGAYYVQNAPKGQQQKDHAEPTPPAA